MVGANFSVYWMQCGGCGGDSISFLNAEDPDISTLLRQNGIEVLYHPSLSTMTHVQHAELTEKMENGELEIDALIIEGAIIRGPARTGMYDAKKHRPKKDIAASLAKHAKYVIALGTCASFGGFGVNDYIQSIGLQFRNSEPGGLLGKSFRSLAGMPVINLAGCPCHPEILSGVLAALVKGAPLALDEFQRPLAWYGMFVHQGCTRNEYHEYRVEEKDFGQKGCLFFHKGCHGPLATGSCNKILWNRRSSKTRAGVPCFGCTMPDFPMQYPFFETSNIEGVPTQLPKGINRAHYLVYKEMAAAAAPKRLKKRETEI